MAQIQITEVDINLLNPSIYNPRKLSDKQECDLMESLKRFSMVDPILVNSNPDRKNIIIGGHQRVYVAKKLGYKTIPVIYLDLNLEQEKELNLRLNHNNGDWNYELLKDFDTEMLLDVGFADEELSNIWDNNLEIEDDNFDLEKAIQQNKEPKSQIGDLYKLGENYLLCADSTKIENVKRLVGKHTIDLVLNDPPYNIGYSYSNGLSTNGKYQSKMTNDSKSESEYKLFLSQSIFNALSVSKNDVHVAYWCDENYVGLLQSLYKEHGINARRVNIWLKNNFNLTPQVAFNKVTEFCVYGTVGNPYLNPKVLNLSEIQNKEVGSGNRLTDDVLDFLNIWLVKRLPAQSYVHATQKDPTLYEKLLRRCTKPGDNILDLFSGSGTTIIAGEQLKRKVFAIEQEPIFIDVAIQRFKDLTGREAILCK